MDHIRARWDARAVHWDAETADPQSHLHLDNGYSRFLRFAATCLDEFHTPATPVILDLGCGTGLVTAEFASAAERVIGVDISPEMVRHARQKRIAHSSFVVADAFSLPFSDSAFDVVLSRGVLLSHYGEIHAETLLREIARVVVRGGIGIFDYLNASGATLFPHMAVEKTFFEKNQIRSLAAATGFTVRHLDGGPASRVHLVELVNTR
jgi:ArsR family transcriptional regulator